MKKFILLTLFLSGIVKAEDNNFSLNQTNFDLAKDEMLKVSFVVRGNAFTSLSYQLYPDGNNLDEFSGKIYLDIVKYEEDLTYLDYSRSVDIPINLNSLDDFTYTEIGTPITRELIVSFLSDDGEKTNSEAFILTITNSSDNSITDPSGTWFDRSLAGTGFYIMQYGNGTEIRYNGYSQDGQPLWLVSNVIDETWVQSEAKTFTLYEASPDANTNFNTPPLVVPGVAEWGSLQLQFDSCTTGSATLSGADGTQTLNLSKLANPINVSCVMQ